MASEVKKTLTATNSITVSAAPGTASSCSSSSSSSLPSTFVINGAASQFYSSPRTFSPNNLTIPDDNVQHLAPPSPSNINSKLEKILIVTDHEVSSGTIDFFNKWGNAIQLNAEHINIGASEIFENADYCFVNLSDKPGIKFLRENYEIVQQKHESGELKVVAYSDDKDQFLSLPFIDNFLTKLPKDNNMISKHVFHSALLSKELNILSPNQRRLQKVFSVFTRFLSRNPQTQ